MKPSCVKQVPYSLLLCLCLVKPFGVVLGEPVANNAPAPSDDDDEVGRITYDQRQTGKYNIHVSIKDVAIIEMDKNEIEDPAYSEDDYYYDDGYMTVAPIFLNSLTTIKPLNITSTNTTTTPPIQNEETTTTANAISTSLPNNRTYSPNLLADIAAAHAPETNKTAAMSNASTNTSATVKTTMKPTQNVIILDAHSPAQNSPTSTHKPPISTTGRPAVVNARSKVLPIQSILKEPLLHPRQHLNPPQLPPQTYPGKAATDAYNEQDGDSKIFKFKVRRAHGQNPALAREAAETLGYPIPMLHSGPTRRCRSTQYRDSSGNCRTKRQSSSILKKLFSMLIKLPFANERRNGDRDDE